MHYSHDLQVPGTFSGQLPKYRDLENGNSV